jgi:hypothetical protein
VRRSVDSRVGGGGGQRPGPERGGGASREASGGAAAGRRARDRGTLGIVVGGARLWDDGGIRIG